MRTFHKNIVYKNIKAQNSGELRIKKNNARPKLHHGLDFVFI